MKEEVREQASPTVRMPLQEYGLRRGHGDVCDICCEVMARFWHEDVQDGDCTQGGVSDIRAQM